MAAPTTRRIDRRRRFTLADHLRVLLPLTVVWAVGFACLAAVAVRGNVGELLLDPAYASGGAWYAGVISQLGILAWTLGTVSAAGAGWIAAQTGRSKAARFMRAAAVVSGVLLVDDLFSIHAVVNETLHLPKIGAEALVIGPLALWLLRHRHDILRTRFQLLAASLLANAASLMVDALLHPGIADIGVLYEDGPKFLGILAWATYFVMTARDIARSALRSTRSGDAGPLSAEVEDWLNRTTPTVPNPSPSSSPTS